MRRHTPLALLAAIALLPLSLQCGSALGQEIITPANPSFAAIENATRQFFATKKYAPNTILSRGDADQLFTVLKDDGWPVPGSEKILKRILPDNDYMVQQLREPVAKRFLDHISQYPDGFDRVDRMRQLPRGNIFLHDLIRNPGGFKLIQYMTTPPLGDNLGKQIENTPKGKNFNEPTHKLYTVDQLLDAMKYAYGQASATAT